MKHFLTRLIIFIAVAFVSQLALYIGIKAVLDAKSNFRFSRYFRDKTHNNFVIGASRAVNSINEKYANENLKLDFINLGFNGQPYANMVDLLDDVNAANKNAVIYVELSSLYDVEVEFDNQYAYYISNSEPIKKSFAGTVYDNLALLRLNNEFFLRSIYYLSKSDNDWLNQNNISQNIINEALNMKPYRLAKRRGQFIKNLAEVQNKCNNAGNQLIYFLAPYLPAYRDKAIDFADILNIMEQNKAKYKFVNLNTINLPNDMFADRVHTNYKGSVILTDSLITMSQKFKEN
ncbi:hypothetical protein DJ568_10415 [Mucilaginibacter hurinus]|uniref:SGNH/GDSL hydrolase family protein n=1 Tax=Mucilaginibacter hurinus TaxID=2201324 RepID=A0A367GN33_9SPHI|nr:hypothetical protein [Mucilaginibacter hurinus]RCH54884.1 hypothetical protein DJ568_10415 [Mucilaginibacter hurinus]